jgi:hypothetical protein
MDRFTFMEITICICFKDSSVLTPGALEVLDDKLGPKNSGLIIVNT